MALALALATHPAGDVMYIPRGFIHEERTGDAAPSLHLTIALPSDDWCWASLVAGATVGGHAALTRLRAVRDTRRGEWFWRRSAPPMLVSSSVGRHADEVGEGGSATDATTKVGAGATTAAAARQGALALAASVEKEMDLVPGALRDLLLHRAHAHNARQDAVSAAGAAFLASSKAAGMSFATPTCMVRRRREGEPRQSPPMPQEGDRRHREDGQEDGTSRAEESEGEGGGGLSVREEIADAMIESLSRVTATEPCSIAQLVADCPLMCPFAKACFAQCCMESGLLVLE